MSVTLNAKGTSVPYFTIGKSGITMYQGLADPSLSYTMKDGDYWFNRSTNQLNVWSSVSNAWDAPRLADLHFVGNSIVAPGGQDLTFSVDANQSVNINSGTGPSLITTSNSQDLHINPATGGGQYLYLNANRWPTTDGTANQVLKTNGSGILSWATVAGSGGVTSLTAGQNIAVSASTGDVTVSFDGTLPVANGGTGLATTPTNGQLLIGNGTGYTLAGLTAGTGISTTVGSGTIQIDNTGILSVAGTTNQISSSTVSGATTLSLPTTLIAPGDLQYTDNIGYSIEMISAAGTNQATATLITKTIAMVHTATATQGVRLPTPSFDGQCHTVTNHTGVEIYVYPQVGSSIDSAATNLNTYLNSNDSMTLVWDGGTWHTITNAVSAGNSGISLTNSMGNITISNNGVLSFAGGTTGLTPASATTGAITLGGTLTIGNGGTNATNVTDAFDNLSPLTTAGDLLYRNSTNNVRLPLGTSGQILSVGSGAPSWISQSAMSVGSATTATTATNVAGGATGSLVYQTGSGTTTTLGIGSTNQVLSVQSGNPAWTSVTTALGYTPVNKAGDTMGGILNLGGYKITNLGAPASSTDAATKAYVDAIGSGLSVLTPVKAATTAALTATYTAGTTDANGGTGIGATLTNSGTQAAFAVDGYSASVNDRILVKDQADAKQNGIYTVTTVGTGSTNWVLTRATDADDSTANQVKAGNYVLVLNGTTNGNEGWINTSPITPPVIGTNNIVWTQFSSTTTYSAGTGLSLTGSTFANTGVLSVTTNTGLSTNVSATGAVTITNTGVTSVTAGTGITLSGSTGGVTISATAPVTRNVTANYTVVSTDNTVFANAAGGGFTVTLPATPTAGETHNIKKTDSTRQAVIISGNGNNIDAYTTVTVNVPYTSIEVQWNSPTSTWQII